jgi:hypothetical protein
MSKSIILWVAFAAGVILLYAAYKGKSPREIILNAADTVKD